MSFIRVRRPAEDGPAETVEIEREIRGFVRKEFGRWPPQPAEQANSLIQLVAGASVLEVEKLVAKLQGLRDFLRSEADRVQREMTGYVQLSDAAMKSGKIIADSVSQWKQPPAETGLSAAQQQATPAEPSLSAAQQHTSPAGEPSLSAAQQHTTPAGEPPSLSAAQQHTTPAETGLSAQQQATPAEPSLSAAQQHTTPAETEGTCAS